MAHQDPETAGQNAPPHGQLNSSLLRTLAKEWPREHKRGMALASQQAPSCPVTTSRTEEKVPLPLLFLMSSGAMYGQGELPAEL
jgi:hypothetical protein